MDTAVTPTNATSPLHVEQTDPDARRTQGDRAGINGWGADLDPANRPAVPMERTPPRLPHAHIPDPGRQRSGVKVYHSIERAGMTPVYGTSAPPRGLSGRLRDVAYRYSESDLRHWLILMAADRVDVGEGLLEDLAQGHVPNVFREMGGPAEWRYNRQGFIRKAAIGTAVVGLAWLWMRSRTRGSEVER